MHFDRTVKEVQEKNKIKTEIKVKITIRRREVTV